MEKVKLEFEVTISKAEYDRLIEDSRWLACLENAGVDNWQGMETAMEIKEAWDEELRNES